MEFATSASTPAPLQVASVKGDTPVIVVPDVTGWPTAVVIAMLVPFGVNVMPLSVRLVVPAMFTVLDDGLQNNVWPLVSATHALASVEPPAAEVPPVVLAPPAVADPPVAEAPPAVLLPPVAEAPPAVLLPPVAEAPPAVLLPPVAEVPPVAALPPVAGAPPVAEAPAAAFAPPVALAVVPPALGAPPVAMAPPVAGVPPVELSTEVLLLDDPLHAETHANRLSPSSVLRVIAIFIVVPFLARPI